MWAISDTDSYKSGDRQRITTRSATPPSVRGHLVFDNGMHYNSGVCPKQTDVSATSRNDRRHTL